MKLPGNKPLPPVTPQAVTLTASPQELLQQIRDGINQLIPSGQAEDYQQVFEYSIGAVAGDLQIQPNGQIGYIYIPAVSRDVTLWAGIGKSRLLGRWSEGTNINIQVPKVQALEINYGAGVGVESITVWVSSRPIVVHTSGNVYGSAAYAPVTRVNILSTSTSIVAADPLRKVALIQNFGAETIYLDTNGGAATVAGGYPILSGDVYRHEATTAVTGIAAVGPVDIAVSDQR